MTVERDQALATLYEQAQQALRTFRYDRVFALMNELLRQYPDESQPFVFIARANLRLRAPREAIDALEEAIRRDGANREAHAILCFVLGLFREEERAAREFAAAIAPTPSAVVCQWCANYLLEAGEPAGALEYAAEAIALEPANHELCELLGRVYLKLGDLEQAHPMFRKALWLGPGDAVTLNNIGVVLLRLGDRTAAFDYFWQALQVAPGFPQARHNVWFTAMHRHPIFAWSWYFLLQFLRLAPPLFAVGWPLLLIAKALVKLRLLHFPALFPLASLFAMLTVALVCINPVLGFVLKRGWIRFLR